MRDSDFSVDAIDIKKGIDRDLFTDSGYLKEFEKNIKRNAAPGRLNQEKGIHFREAKTFNINEKILLIKEGKSPNYTNDQYFVDLEYNTKQIKEIDKIKRETQN